MARILVIDDDAEMRTVLRQTLNSAGHEVILAADGKQGLAECGVKAIDLVITDLVMPNQEGMETIMQLRRDFAKISIIAMSGVSDMRNLLWIAERLGAAKAIQKPFKPAEFLAAVTEVLEVRERA